MVFCAEVLGSMTRHSESFECHNTMTLESEYNRTDAVIAELKFHVNTTLTINHKEKFINEIKKISLLVSLFVEE